MPLVLLVLLSLMDTPDARGIDPGRDGSKKRAAVSTNGERPSKAAWTLASSDTRRLEDIPVPRRQGSEDKTVEVELLAKARNVKGDAVLSLVWANPDLMAYVRPRSMLLDARKFGALPRHRRVSNVTYAERFRTTVYRAWWLRKEEW